MLKEVICKNFVEGTCIGENCRGGELQCNHDVPHSSYRIITISTISCIETEYFSKMKTEHKYTCQNKHPRCIEIGSLEYEMLKAIKKHEEDNGKKLEKGNT
jgi:hypothetical protein